MKDLEDLLQDPSSLGNFRAFMGYSGWAPGQLENEMRTGSWLTVPADSATMFGKDHHRLWSNILRSLGEDMALYADMPADPQMN